MSEDKQDDEGRKDRSQWESFTEEVEVAGRHLVDEVTRLIAEGNVRKLRIRSRNDDVVIEVPMTAGVAVGGVMMLAAPWLAILGGLAGVLGKVRIEVVRNQDPSGPDTDDDRPA